MSKEELQQFLKANNVDYIIFGIETAPYDEFPYKRYDIFRNAVTDGHVTMVAPLSQE
jgi:hypothetical protein